MDASPHGAASIRAGSLQGGRTTASNESVLPLCPIQWDTQDRPATPEHLRPFQHYARQPPGSITRHPYSPARDDVPRDKVFGCRTKASKESAAECMASHPDSEIGRWKLEQSETVYASVRKEPLGHSPSRGYTLKPEGLGTNIPAGRPLHVRAQGATNSTQTIIFPRQASDDDQQTHKMYVHTHRSFEPGEQATREYDWSKAKIDPASHRFGRVDCKGQQSSVKQILQPDLDEGVRQQPVVSQIYDRHKATLGDTLGRPRLLGAGPGSKVGPSHVFGMPSARESEPCVGELIRGGCSQQQQEQDVDPGLGKSPTRWRNTSETAERVFGLPSARTDVPLPAMHSVANTHNYSYGNEQTAYQLLSPPKCVDLGVKEEHLHQRRSRQEMQELLAEAGIGMAEGEFDAVFRLAAGAGSVQHLDDECSLEQLMRARQQYLRECVGL